MVKYICQRLFLNKHTIWSNLSEKQKKRAK